LRPEMAGESERQLLDAAAASSCQEHFITPGNNPAILGPALAC
jgi:hypothetical protein